MEPTSIEAIVKQAAKEAVAELRKEERKKSRAKIFQNTKALMENYNRIAQSVQEGVSDLSDLTEDPVEGLEEGSNIFIESIVKGKLRSLVMLAHVDKCLEMLEREEYRNNTPEKYLAFKYFYLDEMTYESIAEIYGYSERTARRWVTELLSIMSVYLFGADALML